MKKKGGIGLENQINQQNHPTNPSPNRPANFKPRRRKVSLWRRIARSIMRVIANFLLQLRALVKPSDSARPRSTRPENHQAVQSDNATTTRAANPRRKKRSPMQIFVESYLPTLIAIAAVVLVIVLITTSVSRSKQKKQAALEESIANSIAAQEEKARLDLEAQTIIAQADVLMQSYDYESAIALLNSFSGDLSVYTDVNDKIIACEAAQKDMVAWTDPSQIVNLSFQLLIADPSRSFSNEMYGYSFNRNFITTGEFSSILQQLYSNGYVLVQLSDFIEEQADANGNITYKAKPLYLPKDKKPLVLTQTNVNYSYYLIDSDGDHVADANGSGFASKLLWDGAAFTSQMVDSNGRTVTGAYDMVPILESFVKQHPDFSYKGAKATLALTGYNGLFGYRTHPRAAQYFGEDAYRKDIEDVKVLIAALRQNGYTMAFYTYDNVSYGEYSTDLIQVDLQDWANEAAPIIGDLDILVYAQQADITTDQFYSGAKYELLRNAGFRYFLGFCNDGAPWATITNEYVRQGRLMVTGSNLAYHADWFASLFDAASVLDPSRGVVPG